MLVQYCRSVEKENSRPDVNGWRRGTRDNTAPPKNPRIRPQPCLRIQITPKGTQCDKIKAKPTLRNIEIVCSRILLNCLKHLCVRRSKYLCALQHHRVSNKLCKRPCFASCCYHHRTEKKNDYFQTTLEYPLAESKCWTRSRTSCPRISRKRPPLPHRQRRNQRRTGCSHSMGNFSFHFAFST